MSHGQQPALITERLLLRPATPADLDAWTERIFADPEVTRYIPSSIAEPRARAERMLAFVGEMWATRGYGEWLVTDRRDGALLGHCGLLYVAETGEVEIDYALARPFWGRGFASEAARACLRFGFERAGLERVIGLAVPENNASRRVLERVGFVYQRDATYFGHLLALHWLTADRFRATNPTPPEDAPARP
jgi:RimJ/RimL family protein N-acetyltransferase